MKTKKAWYLSPYRFKKALESRQYRTLLERIAASGEEIISLRIWGVKLRPDKSALFVYATLETTAKPGFKEEIMLRGDSLTVILRIRTEKGVYVVLVRQYRGAQGGYVYEPPAGMLDDAGNLRSKALAEVKEETGIDVEPGALHPMGDPAMTSPGGIDERMQMYFADIERDEAYVRALDGYRGGLPGEHEVTNVVVVPWDEAVLIAWAGGDLKFLAMFYAVVARGL